MNRASARLDTGIAGLNEVLNGGLPPGQMYLLEGDPGTGKTTVAMQFIMAGIVRGEKALYITLSEPRAELEGSARSHGWNPALIPIAEFVPEEASLSPDQQYTVFHPSEVELASTIQKLTDLIDRERPDRLVIDSLSELRLLADNVMRYRRQLLALKQFFAGRDTTVLMLDDRTADGHDLQLQSIAHGVFRLEKIQRSYGITRRHLEVVKLRGSSYREGFHDYTIKFGGVMIYPRLVAAEHDSTFPDEKVRSGVVALDNLFGGGIRRGSSTLILGPSGVGKSTIALQYAVSAAQRGERSVIYAFDEARRTSIQRATALGMNVQAELDRETLSIRQIDPAELSPGEFIAQIRDEVENGNLRLVVLDSLNGFLNAMPGERDLILHLHELVAFLHQRGVLTLLVLTQHGLLGSMQSDLDVSYLSDAVVVLRHFEANGEIRQAISVLKQRTGQHERALRQLSFTERGIVLSEPLRSLHGVLTGVPDIAGTYE